MLRFIYNAIEMITKCTKHHRRKVRRLSEVPPTLRQLLASGAEETMSWTEWMATDMSALARTTASAVSHSSLEAALMAAADEAAARGILDRLRIFGRAISAALTSFEQPAFAQITGHRSDVVRQWGAYAVNDNLRTIALDRRLALTLPFAADRHMSVRECAWMAFRPHVAANLVEAIRLLEPVSRSADPNLRRFAIEVSRPRSVWGAHIIDLKRDPEKAMALLDNVFQDSSRYVRLSAGNWLNDASKTRPDWVLRVCERWSEAGHQHTKAIITRGLRTLARFERLPKENAPLMPETIVRIGGSGIGE